MAEFFAMGGYGAYVWPAYAVSAAILTGLTLFILRRGQRLQRDLRTEESRTKTNGAPKDVSSE